MSQADKLDLNDRPTKKRKTLNGGKNTGGGASDSATNNRRFAQATRALRACDFCRKQKTRCFKAASDASSCLRCSFLNRECSFGFEKNDGVVKNLPATTVTGTDLTDTGEKLDMIYKGVQEILGLLREGDGRGQDSAHDAKLLLKAAGSMKKMGVGVGVSTPTGLMENIYLEKDSSASFGLTPGGGILEEVVFPDVWGLSLFHSQSQSLRMAPFSIVSNQVDNTNIPRPILNLLHLSTLESQNDDAYSPHINGEDILTLNIIGTKDAISLLNDFRRNYGRWVLFPQNISSTILLQRIRTKSPLLLTTCCCLSLKYQVNDPPAKGRAKSNRDIYKGLVNQLIKELNFSIMQYTTYQGKGLNGDIEFLQALVILSIYSLSLSSILGVDADGAYDSLPDISLDAWYLSSLGLTTFLSKSTFGALLQKYSKDNVKVRSPYSILYDELDSDEYQFLTVLRVYNHLILVHLINCIFSGRNCIVDEIRLNYCSGTLSLPSSTNFDGRMLSEIGALTIAYNYIQGTLYGGSVHRLEDAETNFNLVQEEFKLWYNQWEYLLDQPTVQFVELCYSFCYLLVVYTFNYQKAFLIEKSTGIQLFDIYNQDNIFFILNSCDQTSLKLLLECSLNVVKVIRRIDNDAYFAYLSDQIHFCFYFSALVLLKLLNHLSQSKQSHLIQEVSRDQDVNSILSHVKALISKFDVFSQSSVELIQRYKEGLKESLQAQFPNS